MKKPLIHAIFLVSLIVMGCASISNNETSFSGGSILSNNLVLDLDNQIPSSQNNELENSSFSQNESQKNEDVKSLSDVMGNGSIYQVANADARNIYLIHSEEEYISFANEHNASLKAIEKISNDFFDNYNLIITPIFEVSLGLPYSFHNSDWDGNNLYLTYLYNPEEIISNYQAYRNNMDFLSIGKNRQISSIDFTVIGGKKGEICFNTSVSFN